MTLAVPPASGEELLKSSSSWDGGAIAYPPGEPEITAVKLSIKEGEALPLHCHPVPTLGYILSGSVEVQTTDARRRVFNQGETLVEVMGTLHRGTAQGGPVEILVFYAGARGLSNTILSPEEPAAAHCDFHKVADAN